MSAARLLTAAVSDPRTPVVVAARRTPVAVVGGPLRDVDVVGLAAPVLRALVSDLRAVGCDVPVDDVVLGNCMGPGAIPPGSRLLRPGWESRCRG